MAELKNALRSGDVSVSGSRQFRAFEEYLMPHTEFDERLANGSLHLAVSTSAAAYFTRILTGGRRTWLAKMSWNAIKVKFPWPISGQLLNRTGNTKARS